MLVIFSVKITASQEKGEKFCRLPYTQDLTETRGVPLDSHVVSVSELFWFTISHLCFNSTVFPLYTISWRVGKEECLYAGEEIWRKD